MQISSKELQSLENKVLPIYGYNNTVKRIRRGITNSSNYNEINASIVGGLIPETK